MFLEFAKHDTKFVCFLKQGLRFSFTFLSVVSFPTITHCSTCPSFLKRAKMPFSFKEISLFYSFFIPLWKILNWKGSIAQSFYIKTHIFNRSEKCWLIQVDWDLLSGFEFWELIQVEKESFTCIQNKREIFHSKWVWILRFWDLIQVVDYWHCPQPDRGMEWSPNIKII